MIYTLCARATVAVYAVMCVAGICTGNRKQGAIAGLFALANFLIFCVKG